MRCWPETLISILYIAKVLRWPKGSTQPYPLLRRRRVTARLFAHRPNALPSRRHRQAGRQPRVLLAAMILSFLSGQTLLAVGCYLVIVALGAPPRAQAAPPMLRGCDQFCRTPKSRCLRLVCKAQPSCGVLVRARPL